MLKVVGLVAVVILKSNYINGLKYVMGSIAQAKDYLISDVPSFSNTVLKLMNYLI